MPSSRRSSQSRDQTHVSCIAGRFFTSETLGKPLLPSYLSLTLALGWYSLSLDWPMPVYANVPATQGQIPVKKVGNSPEAPPLLPWLPGTSPAQQGCYVSPLGVGVKFRHVLLRMPSGSLGPYFLWGSQDHPWLFHLFSLFSFSFAWQCLTQSPLWESEEV